MMYMYTDTVQVRHHEAGGGRAVRRGGGAASPRAPEEGGQGALVCCINVLLYYFIMTVIDLYRCTLYCQAVQLLCYFAAQDKVVTNSYDVLAE